MLVLASTNDKLQMVLGGTVTASGLQCFACYRDITTSAYTPGNQRSTSNNTTDVDIVGAPGASTQRVVDLLNIYNADSAIAELTVKIDVSGAETLLWKDFLDAGKTLTYQEGAGWVVSGGYQPIKTFTVHADAGANFVMTNATQAERFAGNSSRHLFLVDLAGYTQVRLWVNKQVGSASANTPLFRAKYYTSYNTTVGNFLQLGLSAQVEVSMTATGYTDTGWMDLATGARINGCCIGFTELGGDGAADPALGATNILFR